MLSFRPCMASLSRVSTRYDLMSVCASVCVCVSSIVVVRAVGVVVAPAAVLCWCIVAVAELLCRCLSCAVLCVLSVFFICLNSQG